MTEHELAIPLNPDEMRRLRAWDQLYLTGEVCTIRDMAYERILRALATGEALPFDLKGRAIWHCGPITRPVNGGWQAVSLGSTTSSRFTGAAGQLVRHLGVRLIVGKGMLGAEISSAFSEFGAAYAVTTGGTAAYYASQVENVQAVHWLDLGMPSAVWSFKVKRLGPLIVAMDAESGNIFDELGSRVSASTDRILEGLGIDPQHKYTWWPRE